MGMYTPSSVFRCFKCISVYFGVYTDRFRVRHFVYCESVAQESESHGLAVQPKHKLPDY